MTTLQQPSLLSDLPEWIPRKRGRVAKTSVDAYRREDRLGRVAAVVEWLAAVGGDRTAAELVKSRGVVVSTDSLLYARRGLSDAKAKGLVVKGSTRKCEVGGYMVATWRIAHR